ncbi:MAG: hypothetical protein AAGG09_07205 [Pseudomonadota bacterium]
MISHLPDEILAHALPGLGLVGEMASVELTDLAMLLRRRAAPDAILSPLFWTGGDGMETARLLQDVGFTNPYRILAPELPKPGIVLRELQASFPSLDIDLIPAPRHPLK